MDLEWDDLDDGEPPMCIRKWDIYPTMLWNEVDLDACIVRGASFGGPVALTRDPSKLVKFTTKMDSIMIYSASGAPLARIPAIRDRIMDFGWSGAETLVCVFQSGTVHLYSAMGNDDDHSFELFPAGSGESVLMCAFSSCGVAVLTTTRTGEEMFLYIVNDFVRPVPVQIETKPLRPTCMLVVDPWFSDSGRLEVLIGTQEKSVVAMSEAGTEDLRLAPLLRAVPKIMALSPSGRYIAMFCEDGVLMVLSSELEEVVFRSPEAADELAVQLCWLEDDAVCVALPTVMVVHGVHRGGITYRFDYPFHMVQEIDCVRIVTSIKTEIVQILPESIFKSRDVRSYKEPASQLMLATADTSFETVTAEAYIQALTKDDTLRAAVHDCLQAASHEFDIIHQQAQLRAASYGKRFLEGLYTEDFVTVSKHLRILNSTRVPEIGIPLTYRQLQRLTVETLVDRLAFRRKHRLAFQICDVMHLRKEKILVHWACEKVRAGRDLPDATLRDMVTSRLGRSSGVSFADVAATADSVGRSDLATMLLEYEPRVADQVPLLLKMRAGDTALEKALQSGDSDFVYLCLFQLRKMLYVAGDDSEEPFLRLLLKFPRASAMFVKYCQANDRVMLKRLYRAFGRRLDAGLLDVVEAYKCSDVVARLQQLREAASLFKTGSSTDKSLAFYQKAVDEQIALVKLQLEWAKTASLHDVMDTSVHDNLFMLLRAHKEKAVDELKSTFKLSDARVWHVNVKVLSSQRNWSGLQKLCESKRSSPIGYEPFVDVCVEASEFDEALKYIAKLPDAATKVKYLVRIRRWEEAVEVAVKKKDRALLEAIHDKCPVPDIRARIATMAL